MKHVDLRWRRRYRRIIQRIGSYLYINPDRDVRKSILVTGTGRSGTTWLADLIASQISCRIMFEPFHPVYVPAYQCFNYFQYMKPDRDNTAFYKFTQRILTGDVRNRWIDHQNERIFPAYRLIKEIRVNLSLKWLHHNFPAVPILFLIRHPCAVVQSRMEWEWATDGDIESFLLQSDLVSDYLSEYMDLIHNANTDEEKHAIIWSISNLIPLRQFKSGDLKIIYYENLCTQPELELPEIFNTIGHKYELSMVGQSNRPSMTTRLTSAVVTGNNKIVRWKNSLSSAQIERILNVVKAFRLDHLYGDSLLPLSNANR